MHKTPPQNSSAAGFVYEPEQPKSLISSGFWAKKKSTVILSKLRWTYGGELGIRTLETFRLTAFRVLHLRPLGQLSVYVIPFNSKNFSQELTERTTKYLIFEPSKNSVFMGKLWGTNCQPLKKFRVRPVMTTSIYLQIIQNTIILYL